MNVQKGRLGQRGWWWRNPTIIAAIITALAIIVGALIKPQQETVGIHQHTEGQNSPAIAGTNGDVTITISPGQE